MSAKTNVTKFLSEYAVVIIFVLLTLASIAPSGLSIPYIIQEVITRLGRNSFWLSPCFCRFMPGWG
jgi:simple sugar transport system permease protein